MAGKKGQKKRFWSDEEKFTDAQKAFIVKQSNEGTTVAEICRKAGISPATHFNWKKKYEGPMPSEMRRLRDSEYEKAKLRDDRTEAATNNDVWAMGFNSRRKVQL